MQLKATADTWLVCIAALVLGGALGPLVRVKPAHSQTVAPTSVDAARSLPQVAKLHPHAIKLPPSLTVAVAGARPSPQASIPAAAHVLSRSAVEALAARCAPTEPTKILVAISHVESGFHPLRIRLNGGRGQSRSFEPASYEDAVSLAARLVAGGENIDLGLAQINSHNLSWLRLSIEGALDPCQNLTAAGKVLAQGYRKALKTSRPGQSLLHTAYSLYNTGDPVRGIANGYAERVEARRTSR